MICPTCRAAGLKSTVRNDPIHHPLGLRGSFEGRADDFYDERGRHHIHEAPWIYPYRCSNNHSFFEIFPGRCPRDDCAFNEEATSLACVQRYTLRARGLVAELSEDLETFEEPEPPASIDVEPEEAFHAFKSNCGGDWLARTACTVCDHCIATAPAILAKLLDAVPKWEPANIDDWDKAPWKYAEAGSTVISWGPRTGSHESTFYKLTLPGIAFAKEDGK